MSQLLANLDWVDLDVVEFTGSWDGSVLICCPSRIANILNLCQPNPGLQADAHPVQDVKEN